MGYYMRFFDTSEEPLTTEQIQEALKEEDPSYRLEAPESAKIPQADLYRGDDLFAEIEINQPGEALFEDEIKEMIEFLEEAKGTSRKRVEETLQNAKRIVSIRVLSQGKESDETIAGIEPLWKWLFLTRKGLLQADGEGYYDQNGLIHEEGW
jgi:hypothetical protein